MSAKIFNVHMFILTWGHGVPWMNSDKMVQILYEDFQRTPHCNLIIKQKSMDKSKNSVSLDNISKLSMTGLS